MTQSTLGRPGVHVQRAAALSEIPPADESIVDVAILDMNHGFPNVGHDAIATAVVAVAGELGERLAARGRSVRVVSLAVRDKHVVPPAGRFGLLIGTGGPGHIDPRENTLAGDDTILEDPAWELPLFALFDAALADGRTAILGICHTYGILCRWRGIADPLRREITGGKSIGVRTTVLTENALAHPWFAQMRHALGGATTFPVVDSRYYDLVPSGARLDGVAELGYELAENGEPARALTMAEFARGADGVPRIFGVNHHPELGSSDDLEDALRRKRDAGEIDDDVFRSRSSILAELRRPESNESARLVGCAYTFTKLVRHHLERLIEG